MNEDVLIPSRNGDFTDGHVSWQGTIFLGSVAKLVEGWLVAAFKRYPNHPKLGLSQPQKKTHVSNVRDMERLFHKGKIQTPNFVTLNSHFRKT